MINILDIQINKENYFMSHNLILIFLSDERFWGLFKYKPYLYDSYSVLSWYFTEIKEIRIMCDNFPKDVCENVSLLLDIGKSYLPLWFI